MPDAIQGRLPRLFSPLGIVEKFICYFLSDKKNTLPVKEGFLKISAPKQKISAWKCLIS